jgi:hypothetical protein
VLFANDGLVLSMQASILSFALEVKCKTVFTTFFIPYITSVTSVQSVSDVAVVKLTI